MAFVLQIIRLENDWNKELHIKCIRRLTFKNNSYPSNLSSCQWIRRQSFILYEFTQVDWYIQTFFKWQCQKSVSGLFKRVCHHFVQGERDRPFLILLLTELQMIRISLLQRKHLNIYLLCGPLMYRILNDFLTALLWLSLNVWVSTVQGLLFTGYFRTYLIWNI